MRRARMCWRWHALVLVLVLGLWWGAPLHAGSITSQQHGVPYSAVVSVDATPVPIPIDFDGNGVSDQARFVVLVHSAGSDAHCVVRGTATAAGAPLGVDVGSLTFDQRSGQPITTISCVCDTAESATVLVIAMP